MTSSWQEQGSPKQCFLRFQKLLKESRLKKNAEKKIAASRRELLKKLPAKNPSKKCEKIAEKPRKLLKRVFFSNFLDDFLEKIAASRRKLLKTFFVIFVSRNC